jgi:alkylation response protein AidB-like acyl-CoA dehydrogenase
MSALQQLSDDQLAIRDSVRDFVESKVIPVANELDARNEQIPAALLAEMAALGYFGMTIPEEYGGMGLDQLSMVLVSEELSRGWLSVGSIGTRGFIAAAALLKHGTGEQKRRWLPKIASGEMLCAIALTEPDAGSDLAAVRCRAERVGDIFHVTGEKTWVTLADRATLMMLLVRTGGDVTARHQGLSVLFVEKEPGADLNPPILTGRPIPCVGYHGIRSYTMSIDGLMVPAENLLGGVEGQGFAQTMSALETGRLQTSARALGVMRAALEDAITYAQERRQFGKPLAAFQVIQHKIAHMAVLSESAQQLVYSVARKMDDGARADKEASMAKSHATEVAFTVADENLQIHGAYGYSMEYAAQRFWRDARLLKIFEGTHEILQTVIARAILDVV